MADISAFPTITEPTRNEGNVQNFTAGETIVVGQVVGFAAAGTSLTVVVMDATAHERVVGVALNGAASGEPVAVACVGSMAEVANADDTTAIDAGSLVEWNDNAVGGTVSAVDQAATGGATVTGHPGVVGFAIEDIAGDGTGLIMVTPINFTQVNSS